MMPFALKQSDLAAGAAKDLQFRLVETETKRGVPTYSPFDTIVARAEDVWLWDIAGRRYLDCFSSYSAVNQGHCHPRILAALCRQAARLTITSRAYRHDQMAAFYDTICNATGAEKVLPMNSGAEAVESALKLARRWGYQVKGVKADQAEVVVCSRNFHGRTLSIVSFSTDDCTRHNFGPFGNGFISVPFGDATAFEQAISPNTVAILVEPIQGEAGIIVPPPDYFPAIRRLCSEHNVLLILDEIQTGLGRTGLLLGQSHEKIIADITLIGKSLSGGFYPISAVLSTSEIFSVLGPGSHGSTFGGNPLACVIATEALRVLIDGSMIDNASCMGELFRAILKDYNSAAIFEVRGRGLMIGVELVERVGDARHICERLLERGIVCKDINSRVLRISPPLTIQAAEVRCVCQTLAEVLEDFMVK